MLDFFIGYGGHSIMIVLNVLNYSRKNTDQEIKVYIDNLLNELSQKGVSIKVIKVRYDNQILFEKVKRFIEEDKSNLPISKNVVFWEMLNENLEEGERAVLIGEDIYIQNLWGEAVEGFFAIIGHISKNNLAHEITHIIGAQDHYDAATLKRTPMCKSIYCIM